MDFITLKNKDNLKIIEGVIMHPLRINSDETGILVETLRKDWNDVYTEDLPFAMQYYSVTKSGVARDENLWHFHPSGQQDRFLVISGSIVVAIADLRDESSTKGLLNLFLMENLKDPYLLLVPKRVLHGFMVVSKESATLLNFPNRVYDPKEEGRISFSEAKIALQDGNLFSWSKVRENFPR